MKNIDSLPEALADMLKQMQKATSMADCKVDMITIVDTLVFANMVEDEYKRLVSPKSAH